MSGRHSSAAGIRLFLVGLMLSITPWAFAQELPADTAWAVGEGTWSWSVPTSWSAGVPTTAKVADIKQDTAGAVNINYDAGTLALDGLQMANNGGGLTTLNIGDGADLTVFTYRTWRGMWIRSGAKIAQTGGTVTAMQLLLLGGTYDISGGTLRSPDADKHLEFNYGTLNVSGTGSVFCGKDMWTGSWDGNHTDVTLTGQGSIQTGYFRAGGNAWTTQAGGQGGTAAILQDGGTFTASFYMYKGANWEFRSGRMAGAHMEINGGNFRQTGGTFDIDYDTWVQPKQGVPSQYTATGGTIRTRSIKIFGDGTFDQAGSVPVTTTGTSGQVGLTLGESGVIAPATYINRGGSMTLNGGYESRPNGVLRGHGTMYAMDMHHSGKIIADGFGTPQDLVIDPETNKFCFNEIDNPVGGSAGWYATNKGRLVMPQVGFWGDYYQFNPWVTVSNGMVYNFGESPYMLWYENPDSRVLTDTTIDLVNSGQINFSNINGGYAGFINIALLATDRSDVAAMPGVKFISVHDIDGGTGYFNSFGLTIRYDDGAAIGREGRLKMYQYVDGAWVPLTSTVDTASKYISASGMTQFSKFAVGYVAVLGDANSDGKVDFADYLILESSYGSAPGDYTSDADFDDNGVVEFADYLVLEANFGTGAVPEPASLALLGLGGLALLRRRK